MIDLIKGMICVKDFEEIYNKIYFKFKDKIEEINNNQKEIKKQALLKLLKLVVIIVIIFIILILTTKNMEILILLIFVPWPLTLFYFATKGKKIRNAGLNKDISKIRDQIYQDLITNCFNGFNYNSNKGISSKIYNNGNYGHYREYYSSDMIEGKINNKNKISISYVATSIGSNLGRRDNLYFTFRGYFLDIKLNKAIEYNMRVNAKKIEYFEEQIPNEKIEKIAKAIQNIINQFKEKDKVDVTICKDKLYIRFLTNPFDYNYSYNIFNIFSKETLEKYYNGITEIINLTSEILKHIDE